MHYAGLKAGWQLGDEGDNDADAAAGDDGMMTLKL